MNNLKIDIKYTGTEGTTAQIEYAEDIIRDAVDSVNKMIEHKASQYTEETELVTLSLIVSKRWAPVLLKMSTAHPAGVIRNKDKLMRIAYEINIDIYHCVQKGAVLKCQDGSTIKYEES